LARFNCQTDAGALPKKYFIGLPTTMAGAVGASLFLTLDGHLAPAAYAFVFPPLLLLFALLMVCRLYLPKLGRRNSRAVTWFQLVHLFVAPLLVLFRTLPEYLLFLALLYVVVGFVAANRRGVEIS
jgi:phosphatidylserine synthase